MCRNSIFSFLLIAMLSLVPVTAESSKTSKQTQSLTIVQKFYSISKEKLYWFSSPERMKRAKAWLTEIESGNRLGIVPNKPLIDKLKMALENHKTTDKKASTAKYDWQISSVVLHFLSAIRQGNIHFEYDEINVSRDSVYITQLLKMKDSVSNIVAGLDCIDEDYLVLKKFLQDSITSKDSLKYKTVQVAMNYRRYLNINKKTEYILVNIPETEAYYYRNDTLKIFMRTVVGKKSTPTPVFASNISSIVTFPNETFPFYFRQSSGPDNALGVLKFYLSNPFSIFLHSTSWQGVFDKKYRFTSHGCIQLEKPLELAKDIMRGEIDMEKLKQGKANTKPEKIIPAQKVPVFIIYMPLKVEAGKITFLPDVYDLMK